MKRHFLTIALLITCLTRIKSVHAQNAFQPDTTFNHSGQLLSAVNGDVSNAFQLANGKLLVCATGRLNNYNCFLSTRFLANGQLDVGYGTNGVQRDTIAHCYQSMVYDAALQADGKLIEVGQADSFPLTFLAIRRIDTMGLVDHSFGQNGAIRFQFGSAQFNNAVAIQSDGKIVVAGSLNGVFMVCRFTSSGSIDNTFGTNGLLTFSVNSSGNEAINSIVIQADGKIVLGGHTYQNTKVLATVARINTNGTLDNSFGLNGIQILTIGSSIDEINHLLLQSDGKIVASGYSYSSTAGTLSQLMIVRLNTNGSLDTGFGNAGSVVKSYNHIDDIAYSSVLQSDGKIIACGAFKSANSTFDFGLLRIKANGEVDSSFGTNGFITSDFVLNGSSSFDYGTAILNQTDGKVVVAGTITNSGTYRIGIMRYTSDLNLSVAALTAKQAIVCYPNPTCSSINLTVPIPMKSIQVRNSNGLLLKSITSNMQLSESIDLSPYSSGCYLLKIEFNDGTNTVVKLMKE